MMGPRSSHKLLWQSWDLNLGPPHSHLTFKPVGHSSSVFILNILNTDSKYFTLNLLHLRICDRFIQN